MMISGALAGLAGVALYTEMLLVCKSEFCHLKDLMELQ